MPDKTIADQVPTIDESSAKALACGIVMPISAIDGCSAEHWNEVKQIIQDSVEAIAAPRFSARLVSDADDVGVIQKRIVQGVYSSDLIVCDVSGRNPNVMFELGMRLAFDKPTVIIKDDKTDYAFDTSIIEHIPYPRDLRFSRITAFKKQLADKVLATYLASAKDPNHSTFLKNFGTFKVAQLSQSSASGEQVILEMLSDMQLEISRLRRFSYQPRRSAMLPEETRNEGMQAVLVEIIAAGLDKKNCPEVIPDALVAKIKKTVRGQDYFETSREFAQAMQDAYGAWRAHSAQ